jgi:hypothetical protein
MFFFLESEVGGGITFLRLVRVAVLVGGFAVAGLDSRGTSLTFRATLQLVQSGGFSPFLVGIKKVSRHFGQNSSVFMGDSGQVGYK